MSLPTLAPPDTTSGARWATGVRLSGITHQPFLDRADLQRFHEGTDRSPTRMSEALLQRLPELDAVLLAYHLSEPRRSADAGCYLAQRLPGSAILRSTMRRGLSATFTALRVADRMCRLGELNRGALFVYDTAEHRQHETMSLRLGTAGAVAVTELAEVQVPGPGTQTPTLALANVLYRHPGVRALAGAGLAARLVGTPYTDRVETISGSWSANVWAGLARLWPIRERVLLADYQPVTGVFHSCVVVPRTA